MADTSFVGITCYKTGCHVPFWITKQHESKLRESHGAFYCPNGHAQGYHADNSYEALKKKCDMTEVLRDAAERRAKLNYEDLEAQRRLTAAQKGLVTKLRKKVRKNG